jgi:hypothetical protein
MRSSDSDRAVICSHSLIAPRNLARRKKADSAAGYGTVVHRWKETGEIDGGPDGRTLEKKLLLSGTDRGILWSEPGVHEVTFGIRLHETPFAVVYSGERSGADAWKASWVGTDCITGTVDWLGNRDGAVWVDDLKTGHWPVDVATSMQLRSYALLPWVEAGCPMDYEVVTSITQWEKYPLSAPPVRTWCTLTGFDLLEHLDRLRWATGSDEAVIGDHCTFCDAREPHAASGWMQHYQHRAMPCCARGAAAAVLEI